MAVMTISRDSISDEEDNMITEDNDMHIGSVETASVLPAPNGDLMEKVCQEFRELGLSVPSEIICSWSISNLVGRAEMENVARLLGSIHSLVHERKVKMLRKMSRIPQVAVKTFDNYDMDRISPSNKEVMKHLESLCFIGLGENVVLVGDQGTGKTHIAQAIGNRCCDNGMSVRYFKMDEISSKLKDFIAKGANTKLVSDLSNVQCLIIDEVGYCTSLGPEESALLFQILDKRYESGKRTTVFTSNKMPSEWRDLFSDTELAKCVLDRIMDRCIAIEIRGSSFRGSGRRSFKLSCNNTPVITGVK